MRQLALLVLLTACGSSKSSSDSPAPPPAPEVTRLDISDASGFMTISGSYTTGTTIEDPYDLAVSLAEGSTAPSACDVNSKVGPVVQFPGLKAKTLYSLRACVYTSTSNSYSTGITLQHTMP